MSTHNSGVFEHIFYIDRNFWVGGLHDNRDLFTSEPSYRELKELVHPNVSVEDYKNKKEFRILDVYESGRDDIVIGAIGERPLLALKPTDTGSFLDKSSEEFDPHDNYLFALSLTKRIVLVETRLNRSPDIAFGIVTDLLTLAAKEAERDFPYIAETRFEHHKFLDLDRLTNLEYFKVHAYFQNDWLTDLRDKFPTIINLLLDSGSYWVSLIFRSKTNINKNYNVIQEATDFVNDNPNYGRIEVSYAVYEHKRKVKRNESTATEPKTVEVKIARDSTGTALEDFSELIRVLDELEGLGERAG